MKNLKLALFNILDSPTRSFISVLLMAFGIGMIGLMHFFASNVEAQFQGNLRGVDMIVGAKGSPLQLVLCGIYHIDAPTGNIPLHEVQELRKNQWVKELIPISLGDNYQGYRIVGTDSTIYAHYDLKILQGKPFKKPLQAIISERLAKELNLSLNQKIEGTHGLAAGSDDAHHHPYKIVGIFKNTGTVADQLIFTSLESVWEVHQEHSNDHAEEDELKEITLALIKFTGPMANFSLPRLINQNSSMQAALPAIEINRVFNLIGIGVEIVNWIALVLIALSVVSLVFSLFQSLSSRVHELSLLRVLGYRPIGIFGLILSEGLIISLVGGFLGVALAKIGQKLLSDYAVNAFRYSFEYGLSADDAFLMLLALITGIIASLLPAIRAYTQSMVLTIQKAF
ncbi:MAG: ABC transporter permease [Thermaurantimonas sp.]|uniref:ABC transporter permease n=1 Tax=Thermaurantimonas sp. TaxID=2681568 RepID=UPI00391AA724